MRRELYIGLFLVLLLMGAVLFFTYEYKALRNELQSSVMPIPGISNNTTAGSVLLNAALVAVHGQTSDCWIVVSGKVYSVTKYLSLHPGGAGQITPYCGKDATTAFATQGGKGSHSQTALQDLGALYIGNIGSSTTSQDIKTLEQAPAPIPKSGDDDEYEDD